MQERLISALIPDAASPRDDSDSIPLPALPAVNRFDSLTSAALRVSTARMDRSGRIHERIMLRELGWVPGKRLDTDTLHGMVLIAAVLTGQHTIDHRGAIKLPATLRRLCGIEFGPPLVLAAAIPEQVMIIHPSSTVARLLSTHYTDLIQGEQLLRPPQTEHPDPP